MISLNEPPVGIEPTSKVYKTLIITFILRRHRWFLLDNVHGSTKKPKTIVIGLSWYHTNSRRVYTEGITRFADLLFASLYISISSSHQTSIITNYNLFSDSVPVSSLAVDRLYFHITLIPHGPDLRFGCCLNHLLSW